MRKIQLTLLLLLSISIGAIGGYLYATWSARKLAHAEKLVYIRQTAPLTLYSLEALSQQNTQQAVLRLERDLDTKIVVMGYYANEAGEVGMEAREFLKLAAFHRAGSSYSPSTPSVKRMVDYILINGHAEKP